MEGEHSHLIWVPILSRATLTWLVQAWKQHYNKSYPTQKEECDRMKIWMKNKVIIEKHNDLIKQVRKALYYVIISFTTLRDFTLPQWAWTSSATSAKRSGMWWRDPDLDRWRGRKAPSWWCQRKLQSPPKKIRIMVFVLFPVFVLFAQVQEVLLPGSRND